jgi:chlorobactene glucosyltransferase
MNFELLLTSITVTILAITTGILVTWSYFLAYMLKSFRESPKLQQFEGPSTRAYPRISVIVPARNEEKYIARCVYGLVMQDYPNFEIILVDDSSEDGTWRIMQSYAAKYKGLIIALQAGFKPDGWVGKNWACYQGYLHCNGDLLLFSDADTQHSISVMKSAEHYLWLQHADAVTIIPRLLCKDLWTKITLPLLSVFLHTRFSALRVNNPRTKIGYLFGCFYLITRPSYEAIGTHNIVKQDLVEDGALGAELKRKKFLIKMVRGESHVAAVWARDLDTLWHGLRRLIIHLYLQNKNATILMTVAVIFLLLEPFILLPFSMWLSSSLPLLSPKYNMVNNVHLLSVFLAAVCVSTVILIFVCNAVQSKLGVFQSIIYALCCPLAASIICSSFISTLYIAKKGGIVRWRGRQYRMTESKNAIQ